MLLEKMLAVSLMLAIAVVTVQIIVLMLVQT